MDRKTAENYLDICAAIKDLKEQLGKAGSREEEMIAGIAALINQKSAIEKYGESLPFRQRRIFDMRVRQRLKWIEIAARMGYRYTEDSVRKIYCRSFGTESQSHKSLKAG